MRAEAFVATVIRNALQKVVKIRCLLVLDACSRHKSGSLSISVIVHVCKAFRKEIGSYVLVPSCHIVCRNKSNKEWLQSTPSWDILLLRDFVGARRWPVNGQVNVLSSGANSPTPMEAFLLGLGGKSEPGNWNLVQATASASDCTTTGFYCLSERKLLNGSGGGGGGSPCIVTFLSRS